MIYFILAVFAVVLAWLIYRNRQLKNSTSYLGRVIEQHVAEVESMYRHMRGIRHDYKNQLQVLKSFLLLEQLEELEEYLNQLEHELNTVDTIVQTGNVAIDAVINSKLTLAKAHGISLDAKAIVPENTPFVMLDLGILIGNLLSNAYESALKTEDAFIRLYIAPIKGNLYINVTNSTVGHVSSFLTTKPGLGHGFGIERIDQIVKKYEGWIQRASEEGVFSCEITLPLVKGSVPLVSK